MMLLWINEPYQSERIAEPASHEKYTKTVTQLPIAIDGWDSLKTIFGQKIKQLEFGTPYVSLDELRRALNLSVDASLMSVSLGGPIFLDFDDEQTYVFRSDDFTQSLAFRIVPKSLGSRDFSNELYRDDDYFPEYLRHKLMVDMNQFDDLVGQRIDSLKLFKLPDNFFGVPAKGRNLHECCLELSLSDSSKLLIAYGMASRMTKDHCLLRWGMVERDFPINSLSCIRHYPEEFKT